MSANYVGSLDFDLGEKRHVKAVVKTKCETELEFVIRNARYELKKSGEVVDRGECTVTGHELDSYIAPDDRGTYDLVLTYEIADETWVDVVKVKVG